MLTMNIPVQLLSKVKFTVFKIHELSFPKEAIFLLVIK